MDYPENNNEGILIGYWNNENNDYPQFPHPKDLIDKKFWDRMCEKFYIPSKEHYKIYLDSGIKCNQAKGISTCRICGEMVGSFERHNNVYIWPSGLSHYLDHDVILPEEFVSDISSDYKRIKTMTDFWTNWSNRNGFTGT